MRPLTSIVREMRPVNILFDAIKGHSTSCSSSNEKDFACAIRMVSDLAIPAEFHSSVSVCGKTRGDISEDIGPGCSLSNIRNFLTSVFDEKMLLLRLLTPLRDHVRDLSIRNHVEDFLYSALRLASSKVSQNEVYWSSAVPNNDGCHMQNDIFT